MRSKQELLTAAYAAFNARDIGAVLAAMHPDVDWPNGMEGGRVHGHGNVRAYWKRQWETIDPRVEPVAFQEDEAGRTVVDVHQQVRDLSGKILVDQTVQHVYSIRDGLIERMDIRQPETKSMHILLVHLHVKPEHLEEFKQATIVNADNSRKEPGLARFDVLQQADDPTRFVFVEAYYNPEGHAKHRETEHYNTWNAKTADWLFEPRTRAVYQNVSPPDQDW